MTDLTGWVDVPDHRADPDEHMTCRVCRGVVRTWPDGRFPIHAEPRPQRIKVSTTPDECYCNGAMSGGLPLSHPRGLPGCRYYTDRA